MHFAFVRNQPHFSSFAYLALLGLALTVASLPARTQTGGEIDVIQAAEQIAKKVFVLDVREPSEFRDGHIVDAVLIPLGQLEQRAAELDGQKDKPMLVICGSGVRSMQAIRILSKQGFTQMQNVRGGMNAWRKAKLPMEKS